MPRFKKHVLSTGTFLASGLDDNGNPIRKPITFDSARLERVLNIASAMLADGLKIPCPFGHNTAALPDKVDFDPRMNAGYWDRFWLEDGKLWGELSVSDTHPNADSIGQSITEVSPYVATRFVDGSGKQWEDALCHIAMVGKPIIHNQAPFQRIDGAFSFSLSDAIRADLESKEPPSVLQQLLRDLKNYCQLVLPEDTDDSNFIERLAVAVKTKAAVEAKAETESQPEEGESMPDPKVISPTEATAMSFGIKLARKSYMQRISALKAAGKVNDEYLKTHVQPLVDTYSLSFAVGSDEPQRQTLDIVLEALEALPSFKPGAAPAKATGTAGLSFSVSDIDPNEVEVPAALTTKPNDKPDPALPADEIARLVKRGSGIN